MGLDQYLLAKLYVGANYDHNGVSGSVHLTKQPMKFTREEGYVPAPDSEKEDIVHLNGDGLKKLSSLEFSAAYWRKANMIHKFFVDTLAEGNDDCSEMFVPRDVLVDLLAKCKLVMAHIEAAGTEEGMVQNGYTMEKGEDGEYTKTPIMEPGTVYKADMSFCAKILPTTDGFFFGSTAYDQWYVMDIQETIEQLEAILNDELFNNCDFLYQASW